MLDLRTLDPDRQSADRRVALAVGYGGLAVVTFVAIAAGGGGWAVAAGFVLALAGVPWAFAFGGRWRLMDDAVAGVPFAWRGDRMGVWATAPVAGALGVLLLAAALGLPTALALLACLLGAGAYTAAVFWVEARYERLILLELTVLEHRFARIARTSEGPPKNPGAAGCGTSAAPRATRDLNGQQPASGRVRPEASTAGPPRTDRIFLDEP